MHGFVSTAPAQVAPTLDADQVHAWRLPYRAVLGRLPFCRLLAHYLDCAPDSVSFVDDAQGRPRVVSPVCDLDVNWSHSGTHAMIALARALPTLGIDFEARRPRRRALDLAQRFFHADEHDALASLADAQRQEAFFRLWTAKEAVLKGHGEGIRYGLHRIVYQDVALDPIPQHFEGEAGPASAWQVLRHDDALGYACIAWRGAQRSVSWYELKTDDPPAELF